MKKIFKFLLILILIMPFYVSALDENIIGIANSVVKIRSCASSDDSVCPTIKDSNGENEVINTNGKITILDTVDSVSPNTDGCESKKWYKFKFNDIEAYACSNFIDISSSNEENKENIKETSIAKNYYVKGYATHNKEGRIALVELKEGATDDFTCSNIKVLISNKLQCVDSSSLSNINYVEVLDVAKIEYDFEKELTNFPESYRSYLRQIHLLHPNWRFYAYNTTLDWNEVLRIEKNSALISGNESFRDTIESVNYNWKSNTWYAHEAGIWFTPSKEAAAYYLDPRTYLKIDDLGSDGSDYKRIFVFEDSRAYTYQLDSSIDKMLYYGGINKSFDTSYGTKTYKEAFTDGANFSKISPLMLIARSRNETGKFTSGSVSGNYTNPDTKVSYAGYYNYFNVGAFGSSPITNGLIYAKNVGWNDRYKAIVEGSIFIGNKYVYNGQETQYFQKFNVSPYTLTNVYGHQYQTNIEAPITEAGFVFWGYKDSGNINNPIVFHIPVYENMPDEEAVKPSNGNPNNWLLDIKINNESISNFDGDNYYSLDSNWDNKEDDIYNNNIYTYTVAWDMNEIDINVSKAYSGSSISGDGKIKVSESFIHYIKVTAENGTTKTYAIKLNKQEAPELDDNGDVIYPEIKDVLNNIGIKYNDKYLSGLDLGTKYQTLLDAITKENSVVKTSVEKNSNNKTNYFATGDKITIKSGEEELTLKYVLYGDVNGDGNIDIFDLVGVRNIILNTSNLSSDNKIAGDVNKDGKIDIFDLVGVRNDILGKSISQR